MYLAEYSIDDDEVVQGVLRFLTPHCDDPEVDATWWTVFSSLLDNVYAVGWTGIGHRVLAVPGAPVVQTLIVSAPASEAMELRRFIAAFTRLETILPGSVWLPLDAATYDAALGDGLPAMRCRPACSFAVGSTWLAADFRVMAALDALVAEACAYNYRFGYQANVLPLRIDPGVIKLARRNALDVADLPGAPWALVERQNGLAERLMKAPLLCEEYVAVEAGEPEAWLKRALAHRFEEALGALHLRSPNWETVEGGYDDELAIPVVTEVPGDEPDQLSAKAVLSDEVPRLLRWNPPASVSDRLPRTPAGGGPEPFEQPDLPADLPEPYRGVPPFLFVSYKRADLERILPLLRHLQSEGHRLWYDQGIPGGAEWNAVLESRLESCSAVVAFISQVAIDSKWVRRELLFADTIDKPIIGLQLEPATFRFGMGLLLTHYQVLDANRGDVVEQLGYALQPGPA